MISTIKVVTIVQITHEEIMPDVDVEELAEESLRPVSITGASTRYGGYSSKVLSTESFFEAQHPKQ